MVIEVLVIFSVIIILAAIIKSVFTIPLYLAVMVVMILLILYNGMITEGERR